MTPSCRDRGRCEAEMLIAETSGCVCLTLQKRLRHYYKMLGLCPFSRAGYGFGASFITASNNSTFFPDLYLIIVKYGSHTL